MNQTSQTFFLTFTRRCLLRATSRLVTDAPQESSCSAPLTANEPPRHALGKAVGQANPWQCFKPKTKFDSPNSQSIIRICKQGASIFWTKFQVATGQWAIFLTTGFTFLHGKFWGKQGVVNMPEGMRQHSCPARGVRCRLCSQFIHFVRDCNIHHTLILNVLQNQTFNTFYR